MRGCRNLACVLGMFTYITGVWGFCVTECTNYAQDILPFCVITIFIYECSQSSTVA